MRLLSFRRGLLLGAAFWSAVGLSACVKEISSEERLELETHRSDVKGSASAAELARIKCDDTSSELGKARNESRPETDRLAGYMELYEDLKARVGKFEEAMSRNPDLAYQDDSQQLVAAKDLCIQQMADVKVEFETYVRELVNVPTVQEIKGGATVIVARLDFATLRQAIESLGPDDRESLLNRVNSAEKKVEVKAAPRSKTK